MATEHIIQLLIDERDRLNVAIAALQGGTVGKRRGRRPNDTTPTLTPAAEHPKPRGRTYTAAQRKEAAERMRKRWAERKKAAKTKG
jgi:hypothetical protein